MPRLLTTDDAEQLSIQELWGLYRDYVNPGQIAMISSFSFGQERAVRAEGCWIETDSGRRVLDFTGGMGVLNHGHNHPRILAARARYQQAQRLEVHKNYLCPHLAALSHNIAQLLPGDLDISYFPNSGAEAVEGALKLAYKAHQGKRSQVLYSNLSYHGKLLGSASVSGSAELHFRYPEIPGCQPFVYNDLDSVKVLFEQCRKADGSSDLYALIVEPFSASTLTACSEAFLRGVRELCDQEGVILIFDEVFSGWGKTGTLFHFMRYDGLLPDIVVTSKSLGGGKASIAGFVARAPVFKQAYGNLNDALLHSTTYNGFGEECATALEAVNVLVDEGLVERSAALGTQLQQGLNALQQRFPERVLEVRGSGALWGLKLATGSTLLEKLTGLIPLPLLQNERFLQKLVTAAVINECYRGEDLLLYHAENREVLLVLSPPLVAGEADVEQALMSLEHVLAQGVIALCVKFVRSKLFAKFMELAG
ncbi:aspartate aminotransferase family protein [Motiliproteus sediminis]|uniref:aspartate aminotransferase family protein n=1 Tax=Motiliproteus sediminis TaxID=1468178 RepID=UPI001AEF957E|nr:aspartate aminotransferase family protein [Motiliproteus sediminis]